MCALWEKVTENSELKTAFSGLLAEPLGRPCQRVPCGHKIMSKNTPLALCISESTLCVLNDASESCRERKVKSLLLLGKIAREQWHGCWLARRCSCCMGHMVFTTAGKSHLYHGGS